MKNCTNRKANGVIFAAQSPWSSMPCGGTCTHTVPGEHRVNSSRTLPTEGGKCPPHHNLSRPLDLLKAQTQWTQGYLSPMLGSAFLSPVPRRRSRGGPARLRRWPCPWHGPQLQRAGAIRVYISMIFPLPLQLIMRQDQEEPGDADGPGSFSEMATSLNKNPSVASKLSLPFVA